MATTIGPPADPVTVRGPYFDELDVGMTFSDSPSITLTDGLQAAHSAIVGDRLPLSRDTQLAEQVTGEGAVASPALVWDVSIGQSTTVTQNVRANLFYRGLRLRRMPVIGDTLTTVTRVDGLKQNSAKPGRPRTGLVALRIVTTDQLDRVVLDYWRCAMLPLSPGGADTGRADDLTAVGRPVSDEDLTEAVRGWNLAAFRDRVPGVRTGELADGQTWIIQGTDVVSSGPELARLTGNLATVHHDAAAAGGERLVYGGHTIGLAFHQLCRAFPTLVTALAWERCDHLGPVHEGDTLRSTIILENRSALPSGADVGRLRVQVESTRPAGTETPVLDWTLYGLLA